MDGLKKSIGKIRQNYSLLVSLTYKFTEEIYQLNKEKERKTKELMGGLGEDYLKKVLDFFESLNRRAKKEDMEDISKLSDDEIKFIKPFLMIFGPKLLSDMHLDALLNMSHIYIMTLFEAFNKDLFIDLFSKRPEIMMCSKKVSYEEIINFPSIEELHRYLAEKEIESVGYLDIDKFCKYLNKMLNIDLQNDFLKWNGLRENYYRRNIIVHNNGKISKIYAEKMKIQKSDFGKELKNDIEYVENCSDNVNSYIKFVETNVKRKLKI